MAAFRNGIRTVLIPADNAKDLEEIDQTVRRALQFILVERADQVLSAALLQPVPAKEEARKPVPEEGAPAPMDNVIPPAKSGPAARLRQ